MSIQLGKNRPAFLHPVKDKHEPDYNVPPCPSSYQAMALTK